MTKVLRCDLHTHTNYSFDSLVTMTQYAQKAVERGVDVVCFTDHIDINKHYNTFADFQFEQRKREFMQVKERFAGQVQLLLGFEIGEPHLHPDVMQAVYDCQPDMIIGSIHYPADYERYTGRYSNRDYEALYNRYAREMVEHGGFDVLGHVDFPKKHHDDYVEDFDYVAETLRLCVSKGIVLEINTSSLRSPINEPTPSLRLVEHYAQCGGKYVTINSDSHDVNHLSYGYEQVFPELPKQLQTCYFVNRHPVVAKTEK